MPKLKPLQEWHCDKCGEIVNPENGWLEWLGPINRHSHSFHIVHNRDICFHHTRHPDRKDQHLHYYLGTNGLEKLITMIDPGLLSGSERDPNTTCPEASSFSEILRRLHIPYYEEGRLYFDRYKNDYGPSDYYGNCKSIIEEYENSN
jgi:hypothetical protein